MTVLCEQPDIVVELEDNPLSSGHLRYLVRQRVTADSPGPDTTRPFGLRVTTTVPHPVRQGYVYSHALQVAVGEDGRPLVETMGKNWVSKATSDGDEGTEEDHSCWAWAEQLPS